MSYLSLRRFSFAFPLVVSFWLLTAAPVHAGDPPLVDKLPQDCVAYIGWGGWQTTAEARGKTGIGELMNQPGMTKLLSEAGKWLTSEGMEKGFDKANIPEPMRPAIKTLLLTLWERPWAMSVLKLDPAMINGTPVEVVMVMDLGPKTDGFTQALDTLQTMYPGPVPLEDMDFMGGKVKHAKAGEQGSPEMIAGVVGGRFVQALGAGAVKSLQDSLKGEGQTLATNPAFKAAAAKSCPGVSLLHIYADTTQLMPLVMMAAAQDKKLAVAANVLGLESLKSVSVGVSYTGRNLTTAMYFAGSPAGLSSLIDPDPIKDEMLKFVPQDAGMFVALNIDRASVVNKIKAMADKVEPGSGAQVEAFFEEAKQNVGVNPVTDLFPLLDKGVVLFDAPSSGGWMFSWQVAAECKSDADAAKLSEEFKKLVGKIAAILEAEGSDVKLQPSETTLMGQKLIVVNVASTKFPVPLAISWGQSGKVLVIGLFPQPVADTLARVSLPDVLIKDCILCNSQFDAQYKGVYKNSSILFYGNTTGMAKLLYPFGMVLSSMGVTYLRGEGIDVSVADLPLASQVLAAISSNLGGIMTDKEGTTITMTGPMGVALPVFSGMDSGMTFPLVVGITFPALNKALKKAKEAQGEAWQRQMEADQELQNVTIVLPSPVSSSPPQATLATGSAAGQPAGAIEPSKILTLAHVEAVRDVLNVYATAHNGDFPSDKAALLAADTAGGNPRLSGPAWSGPGLEEAFAYLPKLKNSDPTNLVLGYTKQKNKKGQRLVLFLNGQIRLCNVEQLQSALERTQRYLIAEGR